MMTDQTSKAEATIFSGRDTTEDFLFNPPIASTQDTADAADKTATEAAMRRAFPDILRAEDFLEKALEQVQPVSCFGALIVRLDPDGETGAGGPENTAARVVDIGQFLSELCQREHGTWGVVGTTSLGCFLPGKNDVDTLHLAKDIQIRARGLGGISVSIGIASYPKADFGKADVFANARKALTHASFLGADSAVMFDAVSLNISGDELYQQGDVPGAIAELEQALKLDSKNVNILNSLGVCYGVTGELDHALDVFKAAIRIDPNEIMAHYNAGYVSGLNNQPAEALEYYRQAAAIDSSVFEVAFQVGKLYWDQGDASKARTHLEKALALQPESWITNFYLGESCKALDMIDEAVLHYEAAVKKNPEDAGALSALGELYADKAENPEISTLFCEKAVEMSPDNGLFHFRLGKTYARQNDWPQAFSAFSRAAELGHPADSEIASAQARLSGQDLGR